MKRFYLTGQRTFGNRGCEALVRSTVGLLNKHFGRTEILVPSDDIARDKAQWPEASAQGVKFVKAYMPAYTRHWVHIQRTPLSFIKTAGWPFPMPKWLVEQIDSVDAVLAIGGDNYSLDYRIPSLIMGIDKLAMDLGKPVILWGASVGPFEKEPLFLPAIIKHLGRMNLATVRESVSYSYLKESLRLNNTFQMADPAFTLSKETVDTSPFWPETSPSGVLGLNISPLIEKYKSNGQNLIKETASFIRHTIESSKMSVLLVPHVTPLDGGTHNSDDHYMQALLPELSDLGKKVRIMPHQLNASQIKFVISQLRFFIGARTHATIAALSSCVPTISIAYSVKAIGINKDIWGTNQAVLPTNKLSEKTLTSSLEWLFENEQMLRSTLARRIPELQSLAESATGRVVQILNERKNS